jgi:MOSC domain-containing protein YiiM
LEWSQRGVVRNIQISAEKGRAREQLKSAICIEAFGIEGERRGGPGLKQVSLLASESAVFRNESGWCMHRFKENIRTEGIQLWRLSPGTTLEIGTAQFEVTVKGNKCHEGCPLRRPHQDCIMPKEVVYARVIKTGIIALGDAVKILKRT